MKIRPFLSLLALALVVPVVASAIDVPVPARTGRVRFDKNTGEIVRICTPGIQPRDSSFSTPVVEELTACLRSSHARSSRRSSDPRG